MVMSPSPSDCPILSVTSAGPSSMLVKWKPYSTASSYFLDLRVRNKPLIPPVVVTIHKSRTEQLVRGLTPGTEYIVTLKVFDFYYVVCTDTHEATTGKHSMCYSIWDTGMTNYNTNMCICVWKLLSRGKPRLFIWSVSWLLRLYAQTPAVNRAEYDACPLLFPVPDTSHIIFSRPISSTSIALNWTEVDSAQYYFLVVKNTISGATLNLTLTNISMVVSNLEPDSTYDCFIYSGNEAGVGQASKARTVTTCEWKKRESIQCQMPSRSPLCLAKCD